MTTRNSPTSIVDFRRLPDDSPASCPVPVVAVLDYLSDEVPDGESLTASDLVFVRTAQVENSRYWIWRFNEPDGDAAYATVSAAPDGTATIGYETDYYGLTPEQFILGDHHQVL